MDVTCEKCHTEYEFDDALVSGQGTSVRCTQCGHRFKVQRRDTTAAPEVWIVRTVDGQALEFRALRELKVAISSGKVGRDDVLSRGAGRPRRLASIAELEPFFSSPIAATATGLGAMEAQAARARSATPAGLGPVRAEARIEGSDAIPLPKGAATEPRSSHSVNVPPPTPSEDVRRSAASFEEEEPTRNRQLTQELHTLGADAPASLEPRTLMEPDRFQDGPPRTLSGIARTELATRTRGYGTPSERDAASRADDAVTAAGSYDSITAIRGPRPDVADTLLDHSGPKAEPAASPVVSKRATPAAPAPKPAAVTPLPPPALPPPALPPPALPPPTPPKPKAAQTPLPPPAAPPPPPPAAPPPPLAAPAPPPPPTPAPPPVATPPAEAPDSRRAELLPPEPPPGAVPPTPTPAPPQAAPTEAEPEPSEPEPKEEVPRSKSRGRSKRVSLITPTPPDVRYSALHDELDVVPSDRRASPLSASRSSGSMKLIVVLLVGGLTIFGGIVLWQRIVKKPAQDQASEDPRLAGFLEAGEKALRDGDLDAAHEQLLKASALGERDPRVAKALARLATLRAEVPWLELLLLPASDAGRGAVNARYREAAQVAKTAGERAREISPDDPEVTRVRIDVHRLLGEIERARALVDGIASLDGQPDTLLAKAALDLSEQRRPSDSVIDRLSQCAAQEGSSGRARALLVYALARSGDLKRARSELSQLEKLPKVHPLLAELQRFIGRAEKGEDVALKVEDLPTIGPAGPDAASSASAAPADSAAAGSALQQAQEALSRGDNAKAEQLYEKVLAGDKNNVPALMGRAAVAMRQGQAPLATAYYQRAVDAAPTNTQALVALADLKWKSGDQGTAKGLYRKALDNGLAGDAANRARERTGGSAEPPPPPTTTEPPPPPPPPTTTEPPPPPPPPPPPTSDVPPWDGQ